MASHGDVKHDYHLVDPSPWPIVGSISLFVMALGAVVWMKGLGEASILAAKNPILFYVGFAGVLGTMIGWWSDVIKEGQQGHHTPVVDIHAFVLLVFLVTVTKLRDGILAGGG